MNTFYFNLSLYRRSCGWFDLVGFAERLSFSQSFLFNLGITVWVYALDTGAQTFLKVGAAHLFAVELIVLVGTIIGAAFIPDWVLESYNSAGLFPIGFGGLFFLVGLMAGVDLLRMDLIAGLVLGGTFGGVGAAMLFFGLRSLLQRVRL